ncbi:protein kinase-like domain, Phloem protein 2-like protein [Artemisia annua]|uniref:Protein kinase-like domain, Phloem protein 2-like protein n=1 Tax=Artemisia annua TaxID=35608 RepID=A0A2U1LA39_ARTAN|nr:protein kinase-like domain, Phloem protein 2-like protein [Artemisia annua]
MASFMKELEHLQIKLEDIKSATNNFNENKVVGKGGFGKVYKGELSHFKGKSMVAIKRLDRKFGQGDPQFFKEIMMLSSYKHGNLISLLGFCKEGNEMILMYEYASRGSLERILNDAALTWTQRLKICIDAAEGLSFLHDPNGTQQRVLHRDIKSANILLDESLNAKVADFGLSKISPANQKYTFLFTSPVGTPGYCDPLYMDDYQLTKESDVYSFGVVLFEVLCGRVCFEYSNGNFKVFVNHWKRCYEQNKVDEIIFPDLNHQMDPSSVKTFVDIAYQCLQKFREQRPTMSIVVEKLKAALEQREHEQEQMRKAAELEYKEILESADPPLIYRSVKELKALFSKGISVNSGKTWFSLNENGEHCEMLSIAHCLIPREGGYSFYDTDLYSRFSRFFNTNKKGFKVHIRTQFLTPSIRYTVNLVFCKDYYFVGKQKYVGLRYKLEGETETSIVCLATSTKDNSSFIAELYQFTSNGRTFDLEIVFEDHKDNLEVEGILFLPLEKVEHEQMLEDEKLSNDTLQWTMKEEGLCANLLKCFQISNYQEGYAVDNHGKKSLMFSARGVIRSGKLSFKPLPKSSPWNVNDDTTIPTVVEVGTNLDFGSSDSMADNNTSCGHATSNVHVKNVSSGNGSTFVTTSSGTNTYSDGDTYVAHPTVPTCNNEPKDDDNQTGLGNATISDGGSGSGKGATKQVGIVAKAPSTYGTNEGKGNVSGKEQSFASLLGANSTSRKVNFRQMINEERVPNHDTKLPKEAMETVLDR